DRPIRISTHNSRRLWTIAFGMPSDPFSIRLGLAEGIHFSASPRAAARAVLFCDVPTKCDLWRSKALFLHRIYRWRCGDHRMQTGRRQELAATACLHDVLRWTK